MLVWPRDMYKIVRYPSGAEMMTVVEDDMVHMRNGRRVGSMRMFVQRFSTVDCEVPDKQLLGSAQSVKDVMVENAKGHSKEGALGVNDLIGDAEGEIAVICGSGRSLLKDVETLSCRPKGVRVFCINGALKALPPEVVDYYFVLDWSAKEEWWKDYPVDQVNLITCPTAPAHVQAGWKDRYYFGGRISEASGKEFDDWSEFGSLEVGLHATHSVLHMCYKMGFKRVILTGHDYACTDNWYHWYERASSEFAQKEMLSPFQDIHDNMTISGWRMKRNMHIANASMVFCEMDGMPVINASQEGILASERRADMKDCFGEECPPMLNEPVAIPEDVEMMREVA